MCSFRIGALRKGVDEMEHSLWNLMHEFSKGCENLPAFLCRENGETVSVDYDMFLQELEFGTARAAKATESLIGIWGRSSYSWIIAAYACMLAGKHVILFDNAIGRYDFARLARYADVEALVVDEELADEAREIFPDLPVYRFDGLRGISEPGEACAACSPPDVPEQDIIIFTSGTSTSAKGVVIPLTTFREYLRLFCDAPLPGNSREIYFSPMPYFHIFRFMMVIELCNEQADRVYRLISGGYVRWSETGFAVGN